MNKWIMVGVFLLAAVTGAVIFYTSPFGVKKTGVEIDWRLLGEMDYITGHVEGELKALDGKRVKIPGFMVPLEDNLKSVTEFLLVPSPQACIHVPPPPPNQMVYVKMNGKGAEIPYGPIWVYGVLKLTTQKSMYGDASFQLEGDYVEPYQ